MLLLVSCGHRDKGPEVVEPPPGEPPRTVFDDPDYLVVIVNESGSIFLDDVAVTEEQMIGEARARLMENPDLKAILLVGSSQIQGIHLTARLSEVGFKNVTVYYPTATPPPEK